MPVFNLTIPDTSPLIVYAGGHWGDSSHSDPEWNDYINGTFHTTQVNRATASLSFNGSAVYVYGAKRSNHGQYMATLDGSSTVGSGFSPNGVFNQLLYSQTDLQTKQHQLVMTNQWENSTETFFDVDYMLITSGDGNPNTPSLDVTMDDGHRNITYSAGWTSSPDNLKQSYYNETMHVTHTLGASASVKFYGNAITVYGATSTNHGSFSVSLDGIPSPSNLNGSAPAFRAQNMLYYSGGLSTSLHNLIIANTDTTGLFFDLDKVVVSTWPTELADQNSTSTTPAATATSGTAASSPGASTTSSGVNTAAIIGGTVAAVAAVALLIGIFFVIRRRRGGAQHQETYPDSSSSEEGHIQPFVAEPRASSQIDVHAVDESQISWSAAATASYDHDTPKTTMPIPTSTSITEPEDPHRDSPPPNYDEATASSRQGQAS